MPSTQLDVTGRMLLDRLFYNRLFVSKYALELTSKDELEKFLHARHLEMLGNS